MSSHFIEKNVATIKNANETSEGRAKNINKGGSKVTNLHRQFHQNFQRRKPEQAELFVSGSFHDRMRTFPFSAVVNVEQA